MVHTLSIQLYTFYSSVHTKIQKHPKQIISIVQQGGGGGQVKFYPYKKGGRKGFSHAEGGGVEQKNI